MSMSAVRPFMRSVSGIGHILHVDEAASERNHDACGHAGNDDQREGQTHRPPSQRVPKRARVPNAENGGQRGVEQNVAEKLLGQKLDHCRRGFNTENGECSLHQKGAEKQCKRGRAEEDEQVVVTPKRLTRRERRWGRGPLGKRFRRKGLKVAHLARSMRAAARSGIINS